MTDKNKSKTSKKGDGKKTAAGKAGEAAKEGVKKAAEAAGLPKFKKGGSVLGWLAACIASLFSFAGLGKNSKGNEALTSGFKRVIFKGFSRDDDNLYALAKKWFTAEELEVLGVFEWTLTHSKWDFVGFAEQLGDLNKAYAESNPEDSKNKDKKDNNPAYAILKKIVDVGAADKTEGKTEEEIFASQIRVCGPSMIQKELGDKLGYKDFFKNPAVIVPILLTLVIICGIFFPVFRDFWKLLS